jgi:hypothetical protein
MREMTFLHRATSLFAFLYFLVSNLYAAEQVSGDEEQRTLPTLRLEVPASVEYGTPFRAKLRFDGTKQIRLSYSEVVRGLKLRARRSGGEGLPQPAAMVLPLMNSVRPTRGPLTSEERQLLPRSVDTTLAARTFDVYWVEGVAKPRTLRPGRYRVVASLDVAKDVRITGSADLVIQPLAGVDVEALERELSGLRRPDFLFSWLAGVQQPPPARSRRVESEYELCAHRLRTKFPDTAVADLGLCYEAKCRGKATRSTKKELALLSGELQVLSSKLLQDDQKGTPRSKALTVIVAKVNARIQWRLNR